MDSQRLYGSITGHLILNALAEAEKKVKEGATSDIDKICQLSEIEIAKDFILWSIKNLPKLRKLMK